MSDNELCYECEKPKPAAESYTAIDINSTLYADRYKPAADGAGVWYLEEHKRGEFIAHKEPGPGRYRVVEADNIHAFYLKNYLTPLRADLQKAEARIAELEQQCRTWGSTAGETASQLLSANAENARLREALALIESGSPNSWRECEEIARTALATERGKK